MTEKQKACEVIARMPEDSTFEDIQYHLYVLESIERGERDIEDGTETLETSITLHGPVVGLVCRF